MEEIRANLEAAVRKLSEEIGPRSHAQTGRLRLAAEWIAERLGASGCRVRRQEFGFGGNAYYNVEGEARGERADGPVLVVGAHYDTVEGTPGADDNASGVAVMLELARLAALRPYAGITPRFVAFSLEEPPVFRSSRMGSMVYARSLRQEGARVLGMVSLEMLGYYDQARGAQFYPLPVFRWFYPRTADFVGFVGNFASRGLTERARRAFVAHSSLPAESFSGPSVIPGVDFSDHRSFWKEGFKAFMITDTAFYRNPHYHGPDDTADTLDFGLMAELTRGLDLALRELG
ncbi:MAG: M28 family metallopeptidase [Thermodesulfovibrionales bacterium]